MSKTQAIKIAGRPYTFVAEREPEMDGHDNYTAGHLLNSRGAFAGYVTIMPATADRTERRLLLGGPSGISRDAEREGLAMIELETMLETLEDVERAAGTIGAVVVIHGRDRTWRLKVRKSDGVLPGNRAVGAWVSYEGDQTESYVHLKPGSTSLVKRGRR